MTRVNLKELRSTLIIAIIGLILALFVIVNVTFKAGLIYTVFLAISVFFTLLWPKIEELRR